MNRNLTRLCLLSMVLMILMGVCLLWVATPVLAEGVSTFEPEKCPFSPTGEYPIDCGYVRVPEDHQHPNGASIRLAVAIIRSKNANKAPDPVIYLAGGPGGAFVARAPLMPFTATFGAILADRDLIIVDQRGMGLSQPSIDCPIYESALDIFARDFPTPKIAERLQQCPAALAAKGIHVQFYSSEQNAADFATVREALGYEQVNLYGISYGTLLALLALRDHPQGIRSVILDSVLPPTVNSNEYASIPFVRAFDQMVANCNADPVCRVAYPNLKERYQQAFDQLRSVPARIDVNGQTFVYNELNLQDTVYRGLASDTASVPGTITEIASGNFDPMKPFLKQVLATNPTDLPNLALYAAMMCPQMGFMATPDRIATVQNRQPEAFRNPSGASGIGGYRVCEAWGRSNVSLASLAPAVSDAPTLLLSGEYDDLTAPEWAQAAANTLSHSYIYQFSGIGHVVGASECPQRLIIGFMRDPQTAPDSACIASMTHANFTISISVTRPVVGRAALVVNAIALWGLLVLGITLARGHGYRLVAWRATLRRLGLVGVVASLAGIIVILLAPSPMLPALKEVAPLQIVIPLVMAIQAALLFSPDDEPGLEMLLATPRPISWMVVERFAALFLLQLVGSVLGTLIVKGVRPDMDTWVLLLGWIPSALFLSGVTLLVTVRSRAATFGAVIGAFLWIVFGLFGSALMPGQSFPFPFNVIQPFLWAFNLDAIPADFSREDYLLNRFLLAGLGLCLILLAVREMRDSEALLLGQRRHKQRRIAESDRVHTTNLRIGTLVKAVAVNLNPLQQWVGVTRYEFMLQWRRRTFKIMTGIFVMSGTIFAFVIGGNLSHLLPTIPPLETIAIDQAQLIRGMVFVPFGSGAVLWGLACVLPLLVVDSVPYDQQHKISETISSLPVSRSVYLAGKISGVWLAGLSSVLIAQVLLIVLWWMVVGSLSLAPLADMLLFGALPLLLFNSGISILIGATQPNRRRALIVLLAVFTIPLLLANMMSGLKVLVPGGFDLMNYYFVGSLEKVAIFPPVLSASALAAPAVRDTILTGALQLLVVALVVLGWPMVPVLNLPFLRQIVRKARTMQR